MSSTTILRSARGDPQPTLSTKVGLPAARHDPCPSLLRSEKINDGHLQRLAIVYVRQSTQQQVLEQ